MDPGFDLEQASVSLLRYTKEREKDIHSGIQLLNMFKACTYMLYLNDPKAYESLQDESDETLAVAEYNGIGRLISSQVVEDGMEMEANEVVVSLQGIVTSKDLPPFRGRVNPAKIQFYRHAVTIAVIDEAVCEKVLERIGHVQNLFKRHYGDGLVDACAFTTYVPGKTSYNTFDISNRMFKKKLDADGEQVRLLGRVADPDGAIQAAADSNGLVHTADNEVFFFERKKDPIKGQYRFIAAEPTIFQIGDIVEVQLSFVGLPLHQKKRKLSLALRSLGLIDAKYAKELSLAKFKTGARASGPPRSMLKRSVGYTEENVSIAESRMASMEVDDKDNGDKAGGADASSSKADSNKKRPEKKRG
ncbi:hypothetical protein CVT24_011680 [Panaeolus cyanescens]|uniref:Uncharacterized protein n=1 Tax=Panaeolus cyanescens TaxID=181874 RepID=A0A409YH40_9AGAR|nr:hypothetical protein CVT24_011680 [Panaeolus cyanescens]